MDEADKAALTDQDNYISPKSTLEGLHENCTVALGKSLNNGNDSLLGQSYLFLNDLEAWRRVLNEQPETLLFESACHEYTISMLNVCQGQYRNAFKSLRLVLELCVQGIYLSTNLVVCREWLRGEKDTNWNSLIESDEGPFSSRFVIAFFPDVRSHVNNFREMARTIYREGTAGVRPYI